MNLEFSLDDLIDIFGEPLELSSPDLLDYWFRYERTDGIAITLSLSGYERSVGVIVTSFGTVECSYFHLDRTDSVHVLEKERRTFEILSSDPPVRCLVAMDSDSILSTDVPRLQA